jgi:Glyoxalase/Bleomycin resistance protein/Dioxygenase superfamily
VTESRIYHVAFVVAEMKPAMAQLSAATGITWADVQSNVPILYDTPDGPQTWDATFVYSKEMPYIELLQQREGTGWTELGFHHLGVWSDDINADSAALEAQGCRWQAAMSDGLGNRVGGCYHVLDASSSRIEFTSSTVSRARLERYLAGQNFIES